MSLICVLILSSPSQSLGIAISPIRYSIVFKTNVILIKTL